jgi:16S rRNA G966 N2-methylase RsmD
MNRLLFGDNLKSLRDAKTFPDASVDLVYLDPPFNSRVRVETQPQMNPFARAQRKG